MNLPNLNIGSSSLSNLFNAPPRTVELPEPAMTEEPEPPQTVPMFPLFAPNAGKTTESERLSSEEIKARAEVKARTLGAVILLVNAVIECTKAALQMKKGEYKTYLSLKKQFNDERFVSDDDDARGMIERCERFDRMLAAIEEEQKLEPAEEKILFRAIKEDLERKNRENLLKDSSVTGAMLELLATRQLGSVIQTLTLGTRKWVEK